MQISELRAATQIPPPPSQSWPPCGAAVDTLATMNRCANPNCYYLVHSVDREMGPFCCGRCWCRFTGVMKGRTAHGEFCEKRLPTYDDVPKATYTPSARDLEIINEVGCARSTWATEQRALPDAPSLPALWDKAAIGESVAEPEYGVVAWTFDKSPAQPAVSSAAPRPTLAGHADAGAWGSSQPPPPPPPPFGATGGTGRMQRALLQEPPSPLVGHGSSTLGAPPPQPKPGPPPPPPRELLRSHSASGCQGFYPPAPQPAGSATPVAARTCPTSRSSAESVPQSMDASAEQPPPPPPPPAEGGPVPFSSEPPPPPPPLPSAGSASASGGAAAAVPSGLAPAPLAHASPAAPPPVGPPPPAPRNVAAGPVVAQAPAPAAFDQAAVSACAPVPGGLEERQSVPAPPWCGTTSVARGPPGMEIQPGAAPLAAPSPPFDATASEDTKGYQDEFGSLATAPSDRARLSAPPPPPKQRPAQRTAALAQPPPKSQPAGSLAESHADESTNDSVCAESLAESSTPAQSMCKAAHGVGGLAEAVLDKTRYRALASVRWLDGESDCSEED